MPDRAKTSSRMIGTVLSGRYRLEAKLGSGVAREEAIREALPEYYENALRETDTDAIAQPEIDITSGEAGPLQFDAVVEVRPVQEVEVMPENVRFGLPPEIVEAIASAPTRAAAE